MRCVTCGGAWAAISAAPISTIGGAGAISQSPRPRASTCSQAMPASSKPINASTPVLSSHRSIAKLPRDAVFAIRDAYQDTPRTANYIVAILRLILSFAEDRKQTFGLPQLWVNPARRPKTLETGEGHRRRSRDRRLPRALARGHARAGHL